VTFGIFLGLAALTLFVCEFLVPAVTSTASRSPSGFNYGAMFGASFIRPFGWVAAGVLVILAPITLLVRAVEVLGDHLRDRVRAGRK